MSPRTRASWTRRLLAALLPRGHRDVVLAQLDDEHERVQATRSGAEAARWYRRQTWMSLPGALQLRMASGRWFRDALQDARYAFRQMRRARAFTIVAVLMLTIGLGLVVGAYTVVNGLFVRGWDVPDSASVFRASGTLPGAPEGGRIDDGLSYGAFKHLRARAQSADYVAYLIEYGRLGTTSDAQQGVHSPGVFASDNFLSVLQIPLQRGRGFAPGAAGSAMQVVLSDKSWRTVFGRDPDIIGRHIWLSGVPAIVVGVTAPSFQNLGERNVDFLVELSGAPRRSIRYSAEVVADESKCCVTVVGRRRAEWREAQVREELSVLTSQYRQSIGRPVLVLETRSTAPLIADEGIALVFGLIGAGVVLVWCLTCANVGNLFLARSLRRDREMAVRLALGAGRGRLVRQLLTEGAVLALLAGLAALLCATVVPTLMVQVDGTAQMYEPDHVVVLVAVTGAVLTCLLVALTPALHATRRVLVPASGTAPGRGYREVVLAVQIAIAVVLMVSATLIGRGIVTATTSQADFALHGTSMVTIGKATGTLGDAAAQRAVAASMRQAMTRSDGGLGLIEGISSRPTAGFRTSVQAPGAAAEFPATLLPMTGSAFAILGVPIVAGRVLADDSGLREVVINETLARRVWPDESPIGRPVAVQFHRGQVFTVVGVVRDTHLTSLSAVEPTVHVAPRSDVMGVLVARSAPDLAQRMTSVATAIDPTLSATVRPLAEAARSTLDNAVLGASVAATLSAVALVLAVIGVYGVFSYLVEERRREIGIRIALGASRAHVRRALLAACRRSILAGLAAGLVLSFVAGAFLRGLLFGLSPVDPVSYAVVAVVLLAAALVATGGPVRRALRVDPSVAMRTD